MKKRKKKKEGRMNVRKTGKKEIKE